jgi:hypothetical protein
MENASCLTHRKSRNASLISPAAYSIMCRVLALVLSPRESPHGQGAEQMRHMQLVVAKAHRFKRSLSDFMGFGADTSSPSDSTATPEAKSAKYLGEKLSTLAEQVSDLDADVFAKHDEQRILTQHNSEQLTRGMAHLRGCIDHRVKSAEKSLVDKLNREIAKNDIKDKAFKQLLQRVEALEGMRANGRGGLDRDE